MPVPKSIAEAAARADELMRQVGTPNSAPEGMTAAQAAPAPAPAPAPAAADIAAPAPAPTQTPAFEQTWEQKYKVLHGKYNAEVPRLHQEVRDLKSAVDELRQRASAAPAAVAPDLSALTAEEREQYGDDFLKVVAKVAAQQSAKAAPAASQVDSDFVDRLSRIEDVVAETKEDAFFRKLGEQAANWEALNTDAGFLGWLAESDPFTGRTRQELFNDAYARLDVKRVATFFNAFGNGNQSSVSRTTHTQPLESQVTPRPSTASPAPPQAKKMWTTRDIAKFYDDVRRGAYKDIADVARIEQDIFAAQTEGRVR